MGYSLSATKLSCTLRSPIWHKKCRPLAFKSEPHKELSNGLRIHMD